MKKLFIKFLSTITAVLLSVGMLAGCDLITTNVDRDMALPIATVSIEDGMTDVIYKKDLASMYNSQGYIYTQYYGYSEAETYQTLLDSLVNSAIIVQQSKKALTEATDRNSKAYFLLASEETNKTTIDEVLSGNNYKGEAFTTLNKNSNVDEFLTEYEYLYAKYTTLANIYSLIEGLKDEDELTDDEHDTISVTARASLTQPTEEEYNEFELQSQPVTEEIEKTLSKISKDFELGVASTSYTNQYDYYVAIYTAYINKFDAVLKNEKTTLKKAIKLLKNEGLITEKEASANTPTTVDELLNIELFKSTFESQCKNLIVSKYKLALENQIEKSVLDSNNEISIESLYNDYYTLFESQKALYDKDYAEYETALSDATDETLILYNPGKNGEANGYGYVLNLLIKFTDEQSEALENFKAETHTTTEIEDFRNTLASNLVATDLRESWILSGYGKYDADTNTYSFDDTYCTTEALQKYDGDLLGVTSYEYYDDYDEKQTGYNYESIRAKDISISDFESYVKTVMGITDNEYTSTGLNEISEENLKKFRDLVYAYSQDDGSLEENYGYLYSEKSNSYVTEFADACKKLIEAGAGSYAFVVTDYGVHIMYCSKKVVATTTKLTEQEFADNIDNKDSIAYKFKEYKLGVVVDTQVENIASSFINEYAEKVVYYTENYSELVED